MIDKIRKASKKLREKCWGIGFIEGGIDSVFSNHTNPKVEWMKHDYSSKGWFADPFILSADNNIIKVLVEDFPYDLRRGIITLLIVDRKTKTLIERKPLLKLDEHLSFPAIYRIDGNTYITPEHSQGESTDIYQYDETTDELKKANTLSKRPLTDATLLDLDGETYLLSTEEPNPNGSTLTISKVNGLTESKDFKTCEFSNRTARNAGNPFVYNNRLYRPAQVCDKCYGGATEIQEITFDDGEFKFIPRFQIKPNCFRYKLGVHTLNSVEGLAVIDGHGYRRLFIGNLVEAMISLTL